LRNALRRRILPAELGETFHAHFRFFGGYRNARHQQHARGSERGLFLQIKGVAQLMPAGPIYLDAVSSGDLDGDGLADAAIIRLVCAGGDLRSAEYNVKGPRDAGSGMASGKRMHQPMTFIKEWAPATPRLMAIKPTYDVKKVEGSRAKPTREDSWTHLKLGNAGGLCPEAEAAAGTISKSRSNIQNN
jgi:hypothetical protein